MPRYTDDKFTNLRHSLLTKLEHEIAAYAARQQTLFLLRPFQYIGSRCSGEKGYHVRIKLKGNVESAKTLDDLLAILESQYNDSESGNLTRSLIRDACFIAYRVIEDDIKEFAKGEMRKYGHIAHGAHGAAEMPTYRSFIGVAEKKILDSIFKQDLEELERVQHLVQENEVEKLIGLPAIQ